MTTEIQFRGFIGPRDAFNEMLTARFWRDALCESFIVFFMVYGSTMAAVIFPGEEPNIVAIGLAAGLFVFVLVEGFAHVQMAPMNPTALIAFVCTRRLSFIKAIVYLGFELMGSAAGAWVVYVVTPPEVRHKVQPLKLGPTMTEWGGVVVEFVFNGLLIFIVQGVLDHDRRKVVLPGLPIGVTIGMGILASGHYTGGAMNPLIVFGPAVVSGNWKHQWVYWVGDCGGALCAVILYQFFVYEGFPFAPYKPQTQQTEPDPESKLSGHEEPVHTSHVKPTGALPCKQRMSTKI